MNEVSKESLNQVVCHEEKQFNARKFEYITYHQPTPIPERFCLQKDLSTFSMIFFQLTFCSLKVQNKLLLSGNVHFDL